MRRMETFGYCEGKKHQKKQNKEEILTIAKAVSRYKRTCKGKSTTNNNVNIITTQAKKKIQEVQEAKTIPRQQKQ